MNPEEIDKQSAERAGDAAHLPLTSRKLLRILTLYFVVTVCGAAVGFIAQSFAYALLTPKAAGYCDFVAYWATGQQLAHHANPYDAAALQGIEHSAGTPANIGALFMRNLPWTLPFVYPLGFLGARAAFLLWNLLLLLTIWGSVRMLWILHGRPSNRRALLGYFFAPALICLIAGQTTLFALLGLVLFLRLHRTWPFLAGASLWLCALKPHLFLAFGVVLLTWIVVTKSYRLLLGAATALAASCAATYLIDPLAWTQYGQMVQTSNFKIDFIPCLSFLLRYWINRQAIWLQYILPAAGSIWALAYFWSRRKIWDWLTHGSLLMLVSVLTAPYFWLFDQVLVLPALLEGAFQARARSWLATLAFLSSLIELAQFSGHWISLAPFLWTLWAAPAWLAWYLLVKKSTAKQDGAAAAAQQVETKA